MTLNYALRQSTILLAVQKDETRAILKTALDQDEFNIQVASDIAAITSLCAEYHPQIILVDAEAQWAGASLIKHLLKQASWDGQVIALVASNKHEVVKQALEDGAADCLLLPLQPELVLQRINLILAAANAKPITTLLEKISDAVITTNSDMVIRSWNQAAENIYGWTADEAIGRYIVDLTPTDFGHNVTIDDIIETLEESPLWKGTIHQKAKDNSERVIELSVSAVIDDAGKNRGYIGIHRDITQQYKAQHTLEKSRQLSHNFFEQAPVILHSVDSTGHIIDVNEKWLQTFGYERDEVIGQPATFPMTPESKKRAEEQNNHTKNTEEYQFVCKNGMILDGLLETQLVDGIDEQSFALHVIRDVTAQNFTALSLRESESEMRSIFNAIQDLILVIDESGRCIKVATTYIDGFPIPVKSMLGKHFEDLFQTSDDVDFPKTLSSVLTEKHSRTFKFVSTIAADIHYFSVTLSPMEQEDKAVCVIRNITQQTATESAVLASETRYRQLFENAQDAIFLIDTETDHIVDANMQALLQLGYSHEELLSKSMYDIETPYDFNSTEKIAVNVVNKDQFIFENVYQRKDGTSFPVESRSQLLMLNGQRVILTFARDISDRKQIEAAEREQRRLADALRETAAALTSTLELDEVLDLIVDSVYKGIKSQHVDLYFVEGNIATRTRYRGAHYINQHLEFEINKTPNMQQIAAIRKVHIINDTQELGDEWVDKDQLPNVRSVLGAPIEYESDLIGFLFLSNEQPNDFTEQQAQYLQIFANQAAIAIQNARLFQNIQNHASHLEARVAERTEEFMLANEALQKEIAERRKIENKLIEEHHLLQTLIDSIPDAIYVKDREHRFLLGNKALLRELKVSQVTDVVGKTDREFFTSERTAEFIEQEEMVIKTGKIFHEFARNDDNPNFSRLIFVTKLPLYDSDGNISGLVGVNQDITALSQAEAELQSERNLLRTLIDHLPDFIFVKDLHGRFILGNQTVLQYYGLQDHSELIGKTAAELNDPKSSAKTLDEDRRVLQGQTVINEEFSYHESGTGNRRWSLTTKVPLTNSESTITGIVGVDHDITDVKRAEEQLQQILTSARCLLWFAIVTQTSHGFDWNLHIANEESASQFLPVTDRGAGYTQSWLANTHIDDRWNRHEAFRQSIENNTNNFSREFRILLDTGDIRWLNEDVQIRKLTTGRWSLVGVCTDITELKQAEEALQNTNLELEQRVQERTAELTRINEKLMEENTERRRAEEAERDQRLMAEALSDTGAALNSTLELDKVLDRLLGSIATVVSHEGANIMLLDGNTAKIVRSWGYPSLLPEQWENIHEIKDFHTVLETGNAYVVTNTSADKDWLIISGLEWVRSSIVVPIKLQDSIIGLLNLDSSIESNFTQEHGKRLQPFANQAGIAIQNARLVQEIREHADQLENRVQERTAELEQERAQLRAILDSMRDGVIYRNSSGETRYINKALVELTEYVAQDWLSGDAEQRAIRFSDDEVGEQLEHEMQRHLKRQGFWEGEFKVPRAGGSEFDASITRIVVKDTDKQIGMLTVLRDISLDKQLEDQKARFIASASHELRTPIANLKTRLYLIRRQRHRLNEHLDVAESVATWMQNLVETMFDIARFQRGIIELEKVEITLQKIIMDVEQFQEPSAKEKNVAIKHNFTNDPVLVQADPDRLTQVLINLVGNAINHTPENGTVTLQVNKVYSQEKSKVYAIIQISDTGSGIEPENLPHIFQPFYQADEQKRGAGLGLSISKEIIDLHDGEITVESTLGEGTTFTIKLPNVME